MHTVTAVVLQRDEILMLGGGQKRQKHRWRGATAPAGAEAIGAARLGMNRQHGIGASGVHGVERGGRKIP